MSHFSPVSRYQTIHLGRLAFRASLILLAAFLIALLIARTLPIQAQTVQCAAWRIDRSYLKFEDNYLSGSPNFYRDDSCTNLGRPFGFEYPDGVVYASDVDTARALCDANNGNNRNGAFSWFGDDPNVWECIPDGRPRLDPFTFDQFDTQTIGNSNSGRSRKGSRPTPTPTPRPVVYTGEILNMTTDLRLSAVDGLRSGIQFQRVGPDGVGNQSVIDLGLLDAVDVWANIGNGYEVCFPQQGYIVFIDTTPIPRRPPELGEPYTSDGYTCASYTRAGIVVLLSRLE